MFESFLLFAVCWRKLYMWLYDRQDICIIFVTPSTHLYASRSPYLNLQLDSTLMTILPSMVLISDRLLFNVAVLECEEILFYPFCLFLRSPNSAIILSLLEKQSPSYLCKISLSPSRISFVVNNLSRMQYNLYSSIFFYLIFKLFFMTCRS